MSPTLRSAVMTSAVDADLVRHLVRSDGQEDLCFATWFPSSGRDRLTAVIDQVLVPREGERRVHGNASFMPGYVDRVLETALSRGAGVAFLHSHPSRGWQGMSRDDVAAEHGLAPSLAGSTGLPLVGLTLAAKDGAWSARFWERTAPRVYGRRDCESVRVVGDRLRVTFNPNSRPPPGRIEALSRTMDAWGEEAQNNLARLRVGIVGLGSVGSIVAEGLARMGVANVVLFDHDVLKVHNLDRTLNARAGHVNAGLSKVVVAASALAESATARGFRAEAVADTVCRESVYRRALDCDVLFSCVDRPWPRRVLNHAAYAHLIPVIDGGIFVSRTPTGRMRGATWKAHVVTAGRRCLQCLEQYDPGLLQLERDGGLDDSTYMESLPGDHPLRANQNVFVFSANVASLELLQLIQIAVAPAGLPNTGALSYQFPTNTLDLDTRLCTTSCPFPGYAGKGDAAGPSGTDVENPHFPPQACT